MSTDRKLLVCSLVSAGVCLLLGDTPEPPPWTLAAAAVQGAAFLSVGCGVLLFWRWTADDGGER